MAGLMEHFSKGKQPEAEVTNNSEEETKEKGSEDLDPMLVARKDAYLYCREMYLSRYQDADERGIVSVVFDALGLQFGEFLEWRDRQKNYAINEEIKKRRMKLLRESLGNITDTVSENNYEFLCDSTSGLWFWSAIYVQKESAPSVTTAWCCSSLRSFHSPDALTVYLRKHSEG